MIISTDIQSRNAALAKAKSLRNQARIENALLILDDLEKSHAQYSRLHEERGRCWMLLQDLQRAINSFRFAIELNPTLIESWHWLSQLYLMVGNRELALEAEDKLNFLRVVPDEVLLAHNYFADSQFQDAAILLEKFIDSNPTNVGAKRMLSRSLVKLGHVERAKDELESLLKISPDFSEARLDYCSILLHEEAYREAKDHAHILITQSPNHREYIKAYCAACVGLGEFNLVIELYGKLLETMSDTGKEVADIRLWRGNALRSVGRTNEAIDEYHRGISADRRSGVCWFSLANLKKYRFEPTEIAEMVEIEARPEASVIDKCYLSFALAKALEDVEKWSQAWSWYQRANALKNSSLRYDPKVVDDIVSIRCQTETMDSFKPRRNWGCPSDAPIFVVGLPRSGSTLIEQILASHFRVEGTSELTEIGAISARILDIMNLDEGAASSWGEHYLEMTQAYRALGRAHFVDKMPNNWLHIGLIHTILPNSKIIDIRRDPLGCCVANFKQLFGGNNQSFAYDLANIAAYYRSYLRMMRHWDDVLPGRVFRVHYEDLISDTAGTVARLLDYCSLEFDPNCLDFHRTQRVVRTPSSEQVREPISGDSLVSWRKFEQWLGPLKVQLGDALETYRD